MRKEFLVTRQGKQFALYAGLLDLAHDNGLKSIITTLVQIPTQDNGNTAIASATVCMEGDKVFTGIGDASPKNVAPAMQTCLIRMAETRAKSRALRDAVNIGVAAVEELGQDGAGADEDNKYVETQRPPSRNYAQEFKDRATAMGYEGKMKLLCSTLTGKEVESLMLSDYAEALKKSAAEWNKSMDGMKDSG